VTLGVEATLRRAQLESSQKVVGLLEGWADGVDLVDEVLNAGDAVLAKRVMDLAVVIEGEALLVDATETSFVDQITHGVLGRVPVCDVRLDETKHHQSALVDLDENAVVHLFEAQQFHDLLRLRGDLVNTGKADSKNELGLRLDEVVALLMSLAAQVNKLSLLTLVLLLVLGKVGLGKLAEALVLGLDLSDLGALLAHELGVTGGFLFLAFG